MEWTNLEIILSTLSGILIISVIVLIIFNFRFKKSFKNQSITSLQNLNQVKSSLGSINDVLLEMKNNEVFKSAINNSFQDGYNKGLQEAMKLFTMEITDIMKVKRKYFKTFVTAGYIKQLYYNNIPIGMPETIIEYEYVKVDKERLDKIIDKVIKLIDESANYYLTKGFDVRKIINSKSI